MTERKIRKGHSGERRGKDAIHGPILADKKLAGGIRMGHARVKKNIIGEEGMNDLVQHGKVERLGKRG